MKLRDRTYRLENIFKASFILVAFLCPFYVYAVSCAPEARLAATTCAGNQACIDGIVNDCKLKKGIIEPAQASDTTPQNKENDQLNTAEALTEVAETSNEGSSRAAQKEADLRESESIVQDFRKQTLDDEKKRQDELDRTPGKARSETDKALLGLAIQTNNDGKPIPKKLADKATDPKLKESLTFVATTSELEKDYKKERANLLATIAQLSQMAMTTQQRATDMGSVEDPALGTPTATSGVSPKSALAAKSTKLGEKTSAVSEESADPNLANADPNSLSEEDKKKLETAIGAAKKRKELLALKKKLKNQLKGSAVQKSADAVDAAKSFSGDLIPDEPDRSLASLDPEKEKEEFLNSAVFHAMQAQFSMDSGQTREEVQRMLDEVEKELGSTGDVLAGILESNSKSLFERIREAHRQCLKMECVLGWKR